MQIATKRKVVFVVVKAGAPVLAGAIVAAAVLALPVLAKVSMPLATLVAAVFAGSLVFIRYGVKWYGRFYYSRLWSEHASVLAPYMNYPDTFGEEMIRIIHQILYFRGVTAFNLQTLKHLMRLLEALVASLAADPYVGLDTYHAAGELLQELYIANGLVERAKPKSLKDRTAQAEEAPAKEASTGEEPQEPQGA